MILYAFMNIVFTTGNHI